MRRLFLLFVLYFLSISISYAQPMTDTPGLLIRSDEDSSCDALLLSTSDNFLLSDGSNFLLSTSGGCTTSVYTRFRRLIFTGSVTNNGDGSATISSGASSSTITTTNFNNVLSSSETTAQLAFDKIDDLLDSTVPTNPTDSCTPSKMAYASGYLYVCVASNTWERVALATWGSSSGCNDFVFADTNNFTFSDGNDFVFTGTCSSNNFIFADGNDFVFSDANNFIFGQ